MYFHVEMIRAGYRTADCKTEKLVAFLGSGSLCTSKFFRVRRSSEKVKLAKRTVLYPAPNPKKLDVKQLTLNTNSNMLIILMIRVEGQGSYIQVFCG